MNTQKLKKYFGAVSAPKKPMVSIVVPIYNMMPHLDQYLQCCLNFRTLLPYDLIFVDNNSTDGGREYLEKFGARVELESRQGVNYARQHGLDVAIADVILTMDADTVYYSSYIDTMVLELYANADVSLVWATSIGCSDPSRPTMSEKLKLQIKTLVHFVQTNKIAQAKSVRALSMCFMKNTNVYYPVEINNLSGCDDGTIAAQLMRKGKLKRVNKGVYTERGQMKRILSGSWPQI